MQRIRSIASLRRLVASTDGNLYVRWSRGPRYDAATMTKGGSLDALSIERHGALSSVRIDANWASNDDYMMRRVGEYKFLRIKDARIGCWVYRAQCVGNDSDGYDLIASVEAVAEIDLW